MGTPDRVGYRSRDGEEGEGGGGGGGAAFFFFFSILGAGPSRMLRNLHKMAGPHMQGKIETDRQTDREMERREGVIERHREVQKGRKRVGILWEREGHEGLSGERKCEG